MVIISKKSLVATGLVALIAISLIAKLVWGNKGGVNGDFKLWVVEKLSQPLTIDGQTKPQLNLHLWQFYNFLNDDGFVFIDQATAQELEVYFTECRTVVSQLNLNSITKIMEARFIQETNLKQATTILEPKLEQVLGRQLDLGADEYATVIGFYAQEKCLLKLKP